MADSISDGARTQARKTARTAVINRDHNRKKRPYRSKNKKQQNKENNRKTNDICKRKSERSCPGTVREDHFMSNEKMENGYMDEEMEKRVVHEK